MRHQAAMSIGMTSKGKQKTIDAVVYLLKDKDPGAQIGALTALAALGESVVAVVFVTSYGPSVSVRSCSVHESAETRINSCGG